MGSRTEDCGIDPIMWGVVFFGILLLISIFEVMSALLISCCSDNCILAWYLSSTIFGFIVLAVWIIIGYKQYFSPENTC